VSLLQVMKLKFKDSTLNSCLLIETLLFLAEKCHFGVEIFVHFSLHSITNLNSMPSQHSIATYLKSTNISFTR